MLDNVLASAYTPKICRRCRRDTMNPVEPVKHILSFGGGVNTVALMVLLLEEGAPLDEVVFADTGGEVPETYAYLDVARAYFEERGVPFRVVSKRINGTRDLYETCWHRRVIPSALWRWATRDFKVKPIHNYYKTLGAHINQYVGIAFDEIDRMKDSLVPYVTNIYPLIDRKMKREDCVRVIEGAGLPVPVKSGCFFCPFNSMDRWRWLHLNHPDLFDRAVALEENSKHFPDQRLTDQVFRTRDHVILRNLGQRFMLQQGIPTELRQAPCGADCMT